MNKLLETLIDEQNFPYEQMSLEERNYYLHILKNCKDIKNSEHKIDGETECKILRLHFKKNNNQIHINGFLSIGTDNFSENRCIEGYIFIKSTSIVVDTHITRINDSGAFMEYSVLDEFKVVNDKLIRNSVYNYDMKVMKTEICDGIMKGKLK